VTANSSMVPLSRASPPGVPSTLSTGYRGRWLDVDSLRSAISPEIMPDPMSLEVSKPGNDAGVSSAGGGHRGRVRRLRHDLSGRWLDRPAEDRVARPQARGGWRQRSAPGTGRVPRRRPSAPGLGPGRPSAPAASTESVIA